MATIQIGVTIEANGEELGTLASLLLARLMPVAVATPSQPLKLDGAEAEEPVVDPKQPKAPKRSAPAKRPALVKGQAEKSEVPASGEPKRVHSGDRLPFDEFDRLVRGEMKRLSMDRRMPGFKLWDDQRDKRLPTLGAVMSRYGKSRLADLAEVLGMQPPLSVSPARVSIEGEKGGD